MSKYEADCKCGKGIERSRVTGLIPLSCITCRLARVEADLATLRTAHAQDPHDGIKNAVLRQAAYEAGRAEGNKESETWVLPAVLRSGEAPEVLTPEAQDARSWKAIEAWWESLDRPEALVVTFFGPFHRKYERSFFCCQLPNSEPSKRGATRSDALAHAASWCNAETARRQGYVCREARECPLHPITVSK